MTFAGDTDRGVSVPVDVGPCRLSAGITAHEWQRSRPMSRACH
jgi:hypothetical protein